jgi:hypothetical protein
MLILLLSSILISRVLKSSPAKLTKIQKPILSEKNDFIILNLNKKPLHLEKTPFAKAWMNNV